MEAQLKSLLHQIYSSPLQPQPQQTAGLQQQEGRTRTLSTDEFRMFVYKVVPCTRRGPHSWVECAFCHPGEKASRRCPTKRPYAPLACPALKKDGHCPQGDNCVFAHNLFEYWLHPSRYRTQLCSYGIECKRSICFFAHHPGELRVGEHTAQLLALEKELEGNDPTYAASNAKWGINSTQPQHVTRQRQQDTRSFNHPPPQPQQQQQQQRRMQHHTQGQTNMDAAQMAQLRHLQALHSQGSGSLQHLNFQSLPLQNTGMPSHANNAAASATAAALLEAALQPQAPTLPYPLSISARSSMQQDGMASTMKMLSDMSLHRSSMNGGAGNNVPDTAASRLQSYGSMPLFQQQQPPQHLQPQHSVGNSDTLQALQLISQLQQLAGRASAGAGANGEAGNSLQTVLLNSLPQLLMQLSGGAQGTQIPTVAPTPLPTTPPPMEPLPVAVPPKGPMTPPTAEDSAFYGASLKCPASKASSGSPSPANALSIGTRRTADSSCSSQVSDGTRSPPLSHHSDEGIWAVRGEERWARRPSGSSHPEMVKDYLPDAGPFSNLASFQLLDEATRELAASAPAKAHVLPHSLDDADLASGMADMSGASAMIASLSQLIDCPSPLQG